MELSLSVRIAEAPSKDRLLIPFEEFAHIAAATGYRLVCMRPSVVHVATPPAQLQAVRQQLDTLGLSVSMATTDFNVPLNNDAGPSLLHEIDPHLDVAQQLGSNLIRVCMKTDDDIPAAQRAADKARLRGIRLAHQCHTDSLFETVDEIVDVLGRIDRENFGVIYEPANLMLCGQPYDTSTIRKLEPWLMNVYLQNHRLAHDGPEQLMTRVRGRVRYHDIPLWEAGGIDFDAVFRGLETVGYDGPVTVHQTLACADDPHDAAEQCYEFLCRRVNR